MGDSSVPDRIFQLLQSKSTNAEDVSSLSTSKSTPGLRRFKSYLTSQNLYSTSLLLILLGSITACLAFVVDTCISQLQKVQAYLVNDDSFFRGYFVWIQFSLFFAGLAAACPQFIERHGEGSGIPEMKSILSGCQLENFLSLSTLISKMLGVICAVCGGLFVGKEGPFVTIAACVAHALCSIPIFREQFLRNQVQYAQVLAAGCAVGITATFGTPVGGVLFSIEVTATYYMVSNLWWGFFASLCATILFETFRSTGLVSLFQWTLFDPVKLSGELFAFVVLGVICGALGALFVSFCSTIMRYRARSADQPYLRYRDTLCVAFVIALLSFPFGDFIRNEYQDSMNEMFRKDVLPQWAYLPMRDTEVTQNTFFVLIVFILFRFFLTAISTALPVSCGVFVPVFTAGAALGRLFGEMLIIIFPTTVLEVPGVYAVAGAAALCAGVTHTISVAVVVLELTGQVHHVLYVLTSVMISYAVARSLSLSFYDEMLRLKRLPYLPSILATRQRRRKAVDIMVPTTAEITPTMVAQDLFIVLHNNPSCSLFPLIYSAENKILLGAVARECLENMLLWSGHKRPSRRPPGAGTSGRKDVQRLFKRLGDEVRETGARITRSFRGPPRAIAGILTGRGQNRQGTYEMVPTTSEAGEVPGDGSSGAELTPRQGPAEERVEMATPPRDLMDYVDEDATPTGPLLYAAAARRTPTPVMAAGPSSAGDITTATSPKTRSQKISREHVALQDWAGLAIDPAPITIVENAPISKVYLYFTMLSCKYVFVVTHSGKLLGTITKQSVLESVNPESSRTGPNDAAPDRSPEPACNSELDNRLPPERSHAPASADAGGTSRASPSFSFAQAGQSEPGRGHHSDLGSGIQPLPSPRSPVSLTLPRHLSRDHLGAGFPRHSDSDVNRDGPSSGFFQELDIAGLTQHTLAHGSLSPFGESGAGTADAASRSHVIGSKPRALPLADGSTSTNSGTTRRVAFPANDSDPSSRAGSFVMRSTFPPRAPSREHVAVADALERMGRNPSVSVRSPTAGSSD